MNGLDDNSAVLTDRLEVCIVHNIRCRNDRLQDLQIIWRFTKCVQGFKIGDVLYEEIGTESDGNLLVFLEAWREYVANKSLTSSKRYTLPSK